MEIPGYTIARPIAEGGMSNVYLAVQDSLGRPVALKLLKKFDDPEHAERFVNEARTIAALQHRNIITIYDVGKVGERYYIAMEYLEGGSLLDRIARGMSADQAVELLERIAACLDFVHRRDVVHRDLKPSNILFHADGTPKLTDFGIAKQLDANQERTMDGSAFGSPYYLSPEQAEGRPLDGRCDIYALGVVFYQMLTGRLPYAENSHIETIIAHLSEPIPVLPQHLSAYQGLLERMLAKQPGERIAGAPALLREIRLLRQRLKRRSGVGHAAGDGPPAASLRQRAVRRLREAPLAVRLASAAAVLLIVGSTLLSPDSVERGTLRLQAAAPAAGGSAPQDAGAGGGQRDAAQRPSAWPTAGSALRVSNLAAETQVPELPPAEPTVVQASAPEHRGQDRAEDTASADAAVLAALEEPEQAAGAPVDVVAAMPPDTIPADATAQVARETATPPGQAAADTAVIIAAYMQAGDEALRRLRLTTPPEDNAYGHYTRVLEKDPQHAAARAGIDRIADRYAALTRRALNAGDLDLAEVYLNRGLGIRADHAQLHALRRDLETTAAPVAPPQLAAQPAPRPPRADPAVDPRRAGTGNFVQDMKSVWRSIFN